MPGATRPCYDGPAGTDGIGLCAAGTQTGVAGPGGLGSTNCGMGLCNHDEPNCVNGEPNECDPFEGAEMEVCDGLDNDCDGFVDEVVGPVCGQICGWILAHEYCVQGEWICLPDQSPSGDDESRGAS